jgi:translation initiation factor 4E
MANNYLNDVWSLYFHDPYDMNWDGNSYKFISTISSVEDFTNIYKTFNDLWSRGMFFIMREHITPRWEDENNRDGGCFSFKILKNDLESKWFEICSMILGESLGINDIVSENINGISISPKKNYHIVRIWIKNNNKTKKEFYNFNIPNYSTLMYKTHSENI